MVERPFIPQAAPALRIARYRAEVDAAIAAMLEGPSYILGPAVEAFESSFARYIGVRHGVGVSSGTEALLLILRALDIGPGDEVITTALTAAGTAQAILLCGATPRFADVDPVSRCLDPGAVEAAVNPRTAAILPVHLYGFPADMMRLSEIASKNGLALVEDCAQAHGTEIAGRRAGSFGQAAAFSFYPTKNLGAAGDAGAAVCNDPALAEKLRRLRNLGWDENRVSHFAAGNARLDEIQAAILLALLPHLDEGNAERRAIAAQYRNRLQQPGLGLPADAAGAIYHQFAITYDRRDDLRAFLAANGIGTAIHYDPPLHLQPAFTGTRAGALPVTERLSKTLVSLPVQPEIAAGQTDHIAGLVVRGLSP